MTTMGRCWMTAIGLALTTVACGSSDSAFPGAQGARIERAQTPDNEFTPVKLEATIDDLVAEMNKSEIQPMEMVVLLKSLSGFFEPIATGAGRAMGELEVTGNVMGPTDQTDDIAAREELQNEQIRQVVANGGEGIGVSPLTAGNAAAIDEAVAKGVHVVTLDSDLADTQRALYVGALNKSAGATAGQTLLAMLPKPPGTVLIHGNVGPEWADGYARTQGAKEAIEAAGYTPLVSQVIFFGDNEDFDAEWMRGQIVAADPPVVGMVGLFNLSYRCVLAAEAAGKPDLPIVAFDFEPRTVEYMREGRIKATHTQRQYYEGYLVPYILYGIKTIGLEATKQILAPLMPDDARVDIGIDVIPSDKIDAYNAFLDSIGAVQ